MGDPDVQDEQRLTPKGRATRDRIVRAAAELIVAEGLSASNMERVRTAASVSGSQLAHYFADKSALIRAVSELFGVAAGFARPPRRSPTCANTAQLARRRSRGSNARKRRRFGRSRASPPSGRSAT